MLSVISSVKMYDPWPRAKCGVFAMQKQTYVVFALLLPGHVGEAWKLLRKQCGFGNQGLSSHPEETKKARFLEFLIS